MGNKNLHTAKNNKNDEFYTLIEDIEKELQNYNFEGKIVYCNCDDYRYSNFYNYFYYNFEYLNIKKLITTCYIENNNGLYSISDGKDLKTGKLNGNGDFRSEECIEYLKQADVVVTNPPFSLFREYVKQLMDYNKKFVIIGNQNAITYKEIFPYIKNNQLWLGMSMNGSNRWFVAPNKYEVKENAAGYKLDEKGRKMFFVNGVTWFTNINNVRRNETIDLYRRYSFEDYPKYDNYDAIEVSRVENIPMDYDGIMGVPITFLYKYNPTQFKIIWTSDRGGDGYLEDIKNKNWKGLWDSCFVKGKKVYKRILIQKI